MGKVIERLKEATSYLGCLIPILIPILLFIGLMVWIRGLSKADAVREAEYSDNIDNIIEQQDTVVMIKMYEELLRKECARDHYKYILQELADLSEQREQYAEAYNYLDRIYETDAIKFHKAKLLDITDRKEEAKAILQGMIEENVKYQPVSALGSISHYLLDKCSYRTPRKRYGDYFLSLIRKIYALDLLNDISDNSQEYLETLYKAVRCFDGFDDIAIACKEFNRKHPGTYDYTDSCGYIMALQDLGLDIINILQDLGFDFSSDLLGFDFMPQLAMLGKWNLINDAICLTDKHYGLERTSEYIRNEIKETLQTSIYQGLLLRAYRKFSHIDETFPTSFGYDDFRKYNREGGESITVISPTTIGGNSELLKQGITDERILISLNNWTLADSTLMTADRIPEFIGQEKRMVLLNKNYQADTVVISTDRIGANMIVWSIPESVWKMLIHDFVYKTEMDLN